MIFDELAKKTLKATTDNSPAILTAIGVVGTLTTAYLTGTATLKAAKLTWADSPDYQVPRKEFLQTTWKLYIPAATTAAVTVTAIVGANRIGNKRAAAMAAAYAISEKAYSEYKDKVVEHLGKNKEQKVRDDIQQDRVGNARPQLFVSGDGKILCYDKFSGRYFESSMEELKKGQNDLNYQVLNNYYASLSDFYDLVGLDRTGVSDELGWNSDELMEIEFSTVLSDDQKPCIAIDFRVQPIRNYYRIH